jgi:predicted dehydrogenase
MRVGLVGLGDAGRHHARSLLALDRKGALLWTAVCARDAGRIEQARAELGAPEHARAYAGLDELLAADACDAVILATPDGEHAAQAEQCVDRGLHVLVEKPLALSQPEGERVLERARAKGAVVAVGYHLRHHAGHRAVHLRLAEHIGALRSIYLRWAWPDPATEGWRARGDAARFWSLAALGTHAIDLALWMANSPVVDVTAITVPARGVDRAAEVSLRFESDVLAHVSVAVTHRAVSRFVLTGDAGEIECVGTLGARGDGQVWLRASRKEPRALPFEQLDPYRAELADFIAKAEARARVTESAPDAIANLAIMDSIDRARASR